MFICILFLERDMKYLELNYKSIDGWSNYVVTSCGRVFKKETGKEVAQVLSGNPQYKYVNLQRDKQRKLIRVHRLVALAFLPVVEGKAFVDHIDRDKMNNDLSNLRWATASENHRNMANNRLLVCGNFAIDLLTPSELYFAERNNLLSLPVEDIKTIYLLCKSIGCSYKKLTVPLMVNGETHTAGAWCIYLGIKYKTLISNTRKYSNSQVEWVEDAEEFGVTTYRTKTTKEVRAANRQTKLARKYGMTVEEYLNKDIKTITVKGKEVRYKTLVDLCLTLNVNKDRIRARIKKQGMSLEDALQAPLGRVNKWVYKGGVYTVMDLCKIIGLSQRKFTDYKVKYGESFMDRLGIGHLNIQPCSL